MSAAPMPHRVLLIEELHRRYASPETSAWPASHLRFLRKKYAWIAVVGGARAGKRVVDVLVSAFLLIALAPLFLLIALLVKLEDGGPVLYWQRRVGLWGREFLLPKFRSMVPNAAALKQGLAARNDHGDSITFKLRKDPRITRVGRVLRRTSVDELPQLWNVLVGEMSLVGPRPPVPEEVARYALADRRRLDVRPGLTCIWQVSGRGDIAFPGQVALDLLYIESQSAWLDLRLLLQTIPAVLLGKGAY
jgi:lipopolysaccharide/colanic/teichoic acid biosynthesis glycosyltransferase